ncbi:MAG TPA: helix-turn-helix domain-containing protein, partial [Acidimicrobiales bacterium]
MLSRSVTGPGNERDEGAGERLVTQREAAELAGCSKDTIVRARRAGRFPHARLDGQAWMVPIDDLVAAGFSATGAEGRGTRPGAGVDHKAVNLDLARAQARIDALEDLVDRQDAEL